MCGRDRQTLLLAERKLGLPTSYPRALCSQGHIVTCDQRNIVGPSRSSRCYWPQCVLHCHTDVKSRCEVPSALRPPPPVSLTVHLGVPGSKQPDPLEKDSYTTPGKGIRD